MARASGQALDPGTLLDDGYTKATLLQVEGLEGKPFRAGAGQLAHAAAALSEGTRHGRRIGMVSGACAHVTSYYLLLDLMYRNSRPCPQK